MPDGAKFCANCGVTAEIKKPSQPVHTPPPIAATTPPIQTSPPPSVQQQHNNSQHQNTAPPQQKRLGVPPLSVGQYLGMMVVMAIPLVNLIMLFVWGFGSNENPNRKNFAKAYLIVFAIGIVLTIISFTAIISLISSFAGSMSDFM
ncbi:MAG TPA: hypothetical protein VFD57_07185 [Clostridia bacterium]|nr:hypothetical protein [Clostridia bacterium]